MNTRNILMRPDAQVVFKRIEELARAQIRMPNHERIADAVASMGFAKERMAGFAHETTMNIDLGEGIYLHWMNDALTEGYARLFGEIAQGMLCVRIIDTRDGIEDVAPIPKVNLYRRNLPRYKIDPDTDLDALGWHLVVDLADEYDVGRADYLRDMAEVATHTLLGLDMTMADGLEFIFDDGSVWFRRTTYG